MVAIENVTEKHVQGFWTQYSSLMHNLVELFPENAKISKAKEDSENCSDKRVLLDQWNQRICLDQQTLKQLLERDPELFVNCSIFSDWGLTQVWIKGELSTSDKQNLWSYLKNLCQHASELIDDDGLINAQIVNTNFNAIPSIISKEQIAHSTQSLGLDNMAEPIAGLCDALPSDVLEKVKGIIEGQVSDGNTGPPDVAQLTQSIMSNLSPEDISRTVASTQNIVSSLMGNPAFAGLMQNFGQSLQQ